MDADATPSHRNPSTIDLLLEEADKAQRKGHLLLAKVLHQASDELGLALARAEEARLLGEAVEATRALLGEDGSRPFLDDAVGAALARRDLTILALRNAAVQARDKFLFYAASHEAKGTEDGAIKASVNRSMAAMLDAVIGEAS